MHAAHRSSCWQKDFLEVEAGHHLGQQEPVGIGSLPFQMATNGSVSLQMATNGSVSFQMALYHFVAEWYKPHQPVRRHRLQTDRGYLESPRDQSLVAQQMDLTSVHFP